VKKNENGAGFQGKVQCSYNENEWPVIETLLLANYNL
jgi:hypothetical protein